MGSKERLELDGKSWGLKGLKFREVQGRSMKWVWAMLGLLALVPAYRVVYGLSGGAMAGVMLPKLELLGLAATVWLFVWVMVLLSSAWKMVTEVRDGGVYVRFVPYVLEMEEIPVEGARKVSVYGREGKVRRGVRRTEEGVSYSAGARGGVRIDYEDGRYVEIGSRRAEELAEAIGALIRRRGEEVEGEEAAGGIHIERDRPREFVVVFLNLVLVGAGGWQVVVGVKQGEAWRIAIGGVVLVLLMVLIARRRFVAREGRGESRGEEEEE